MSFSAVSRHTCIVFRYSHSNKVSLLRFGQFPLFPYAHTYSVIEPSINVVYVTLHARYSIVVKPSSCVDLDFLKAWLDTLYRPAGRQVFQLRLKLLP